MGLLSFSAELEFHLIEIKWKLNVDLDYFTKSMEDSQLSNIKCSIIKRYTILALANMRRTITTFLKSPRQSEELSYSQAGESLLR